MTIRPASPDEIARHNKADVASIRKWKRAGMEDVVIALRLEHRNIQRLRQRIQVRP